MKRILYLIIFSFFIFSATFATHERAGEILYRHIDGLTYEITILTYTYSPSPADRPELTILWGDGTSSLLGRIDIEPITNIIQRNVYLGQHTYAAPGTFKLSVEDPNRNYGIVNIPNSVNIPFYIETELVINPFLGPNTSVVLLNPPLDYGCIDQIYIHNPGAYDPDGDSISYKMTICRGAGGLEIPGYQFPHEVDPVNPGTLDINAFTGDLVWDSPTIQGEYNVAFLIEEWRYGQRIGYVTRDLQIQVVVCDNEPPEIFVIGDTCINAGDTLSFEVTATDPDGDVVTLTALGSPFLQTISPATMDPNPAQAPVTVTAQFEWNTHCAHVLKYPHPLYFKAIDNDNIVNLSSYKTVNIKVVAPAPENPAAIPAGTSIMLSWDQSICDNAIGYDIYRSIDSTGFVPDHCVTGVPADIGYMKIAEIDGLDNTSYTDNNYGSGLIHGIKYCYMIVAVFPDGAESYASVEVCATLKKDLPIITHVSILTTDTQNGSIDVKWSKPTELDTIQIPGPYEYQLFRKDNSTGSDFIQVVSLGSLNDTTYLDTQVNTEELQFRYRVDFFSKELGIDSLIGSTAIAPSIFLNITPSDRALQLLWNNDVPWNNDYWEIYRKDPDSVNFHPAGISSEPQFTDTTELENGKEYCYFVKSIGGYSSLGLVDPIINFSQENCGIPIDNVPPCDSLNLSVETNCESYYNYLSWEYPYDQCGYEDSIYFNIYFAPGGEISDFILVHTTGPDEFEYSYSTTPPSIVGCFYITALDTMHNESLPDTVICIDIDECGNIIFPVVITPNSDGKNDFFFADSANSVQQFRLTIFNRWGVIVYETEDPYFQWDGRDQNNNQECSPGTYFYEGFYSVFTLRGPVEKTVRGSITLIR